MEKFGVRAASSYTGVPEATLRYWRTLGNVGPASYKLGRRVFYDRTELDRWLAEQKAATTRGGMAAV